jgi:hypothetical protein
LRFESAHPIEQQDREQHDQQTERTLVALINSLLFVDFRVEVLAPDGDGAFDFAGIHILIAIRPPKVLSRRPSFDAITVTKKKLER